MSKIIKRFADILIAAIALLIFSPLIIFIAVVIKMTSAGPVIFRQKRVGKNGKIFTLYKFRTMRTDVDPYGFSPKDEADPRVTGIGKVLRKFSFDELPQLMNVLKGEMTLVGPRPLLEWQYQQWTDHQKRRCEVKPGLTGWAQINGRASLTHEDKIEMDVWYVDHANLLLDLKILLKTVILVYRGQETLERQYSQFEKTHEKIDSNT